MGFDGYADFEKDFSKFIEELKNTDAQPYIPYDKDMHSDPEVGIVMVGFFYLWREQGADLKKLHRAWYYKDGDPDNFKDGAYVVFVEMLPGDRKDEGFLFIGERKNGYIKELINARINVPRTLEEFEEEVKMLSGRLNS